MSSSTTDLITFYHANRIFSGSLIRLVTNLHNLLIIGIPVIFDLLSYLLFAPWLTLCEFLK